MGKKSDDWMSNGKEFQRTDAATGNVHRPTVDWRKGGTWSSCVKMVGVGDDQVDQRRKPADTSMMEWGYAALEMPWQPPWNWPATSADFSNFCPQNIDYPALEQRSWSWDVPVFSFLPVALYLFYSYMHTAI